MAGLLEGRVAIITGAGRGIGREEALLFAKEGAKVVVNDLGAGFDGSGKDDSPAAQVVQEIKDGGGEAVANGESVADFNGAKRIIECAVDTFGKLNTLVNNAGILRDRMVFNMGEDDFDAVMGVHVKGTFNVTRHACEYWRTEHKGGTDHKGRIVNTSSDAGLLGNAGQFNYAAAKAAVAMMAIVADKEMSKYGVSANAIAPLARTRMTTDATPQTAGMMAAPEEADKFDVFNPKNIAPLVTFLGSDKAADVHGQVLRVGGGVVWMMKPWTTAGYVKKDGTWDPSELGDRLNAELAKGITQGDDLGKVFSVLQ